MCAYVCIVSTKYCSVRNQVFPHDECLLYLCLFLTPHELSNGSCACDPFAPDKGRQDHRHYTTHSDSPVIVKCVYEQSNAKIMKI